MLSMQTKLKQMLESIGFFTTKILKLISNIKNLPREAGRVTKNDPYFAIIIAIGLICFGLSFTTLFGGWVRYEITLNEKVRVAKIGLFNSALEGIWRYLGYAKCKEQALNGGMNTVCNARFGMGLALVTSLIFTMFICLLLMLIASRTLLDFRAAQAKILVLKICSFNVFWNIVTLILGHFILFRIISSDHLITNATYGVALYATIVQAILYAILIPLVYFMVSADGVIQDRPRSISTQSHSTQDKTVRESFIELKNTPSVE